MARAVKQAARDGAAGGPGRDGGEGGLSAEQERSCRTQTRAAGSCKTPLLASNFFIGSFPFCIS